MIRLDEENRSPASRRGHLRDRNEAARAGNERVATRDPKLPGDVTKGDAPDGKAIGDLVPSMSPPRTSWPRVFPGL